MVSNHTCDFKSNSRFAFILKSRASLQTKLHSTQFNYLYQSDYINQFCSNVILFLFFSNCIVFKLEKRVLVVFIPEFCTTAWATYLIEVESNLKLAVVHERVKYLKTSCVIFHSCNFCVIKRAIGCQS